MGTHGRCRRLIGRVLQSVGLALMFAALAGSAVPFLPAYADFAAPIRSLSDRIAAVVQAATGDATAPVPSPSPSPSDPLVVKPVKRPLRKARGGPLTFGLSGSFSLGDRQTTTTQDGQTSGFAAAASSVNQPSESTGLLAEISRRTATTSADFKLPLGLGIGSTGTIVGTAQALYATPTFALGYGSEPLALLGQLPLGSTLRGPSYIRPLRSGDLTFFEGPTISVDSETVPLYGIRLRDLSGGSLYEAALTYANGLETGRAETLTLGAATAAKALSFEGEAAVQTRTGGDLSTSGLAYQFRLDDGNAVSDFTTTIRSVANGFVALGSGEIPGDKLIDTSFHSSGKIDSSFDVALETLGGLSSVNSRRSSFSLTFPVSTGSLSLAGQEQRSDGNATPPEWTGALNSQLSIGGAKASAILGLQLTRSTQVVGGELGGSGVSAQLEQLVGGNISVGESYQVLRQVSNVSGIDVQSTEGATIQRTFGRTTLGITDTITRTLSSLSDAVQSIPLLTLTRQLSPAISVQTSYGLQTLRDRLNPTLNGRSRVFNIQLTAPFSFGSGIVTGRSDPRLPATIVGRIVSDVGSNRALASSNGAGISNIVVVLDDRDVVRSDVTGGFQFSFVSPGAHQLRVDSASLPRGVTVDQPILPISVQGGQTAQVLFQVGNFGGIAGHVYGRDASGQTIPLDNVMLRVDSANYQKTGHDGSYGFGRLQPGEHMVSIIESSVPAFASFAAGDETHKVSVTNGRYAQLDFTAQPLGSIAGQVLYDASAQKLGNSGPAADAYVVAEPGEHAAITDFDGTYIIDNLPPGTYTVSVDPETVPDGTSPVDPAASVTLGASEHYEGLLFHVGAEVKKVVFSLLQSGASSSSGAAIRVVASRLPPQGATDVVIDPGGKASKVEITAFGATVPAHFDAAKNRWIGTVVVPPGTKPGSYDVTAALTGTPVASVLGSLTVDPKIPLFLIQVQPANASVGQYVHIRARLLVDVHAGDRIQWEDGSTTVLGPPVAGRVFTFGLRISLRPLHGVLLTRTSKLPISIQ